jgi:hypothetical protein
MQRTEASAMEDRPNSRSTAGTPKSGSSASAQAGSDTRRAGAGADPRADLEAGKRKAKEIAGDTAQRAKLEAEHRKDAAAGQMDEVASAVERAADELEDNPTLSRYASDLAGSMHGIAGRLRDRSVDELAGDVRQLARTNPTLFVLGSIGVGLALSRFLKASPRRQHPASDSTSDVDRTEPATGAVSASAYEPPVGTMPNPYSDAALGRPTADPRGPAFTVRGTEH